MNSSPPQRTCIACRRKADQSSFFRVAKSREGVFTILDSGPSYSRSVYLCPSSECVEKGLGKGRLAKSLRREIGQAELDDIANDLICKLNKKRTV